MNIDSLAARVGLELHLYEDGQLARTSQPRLLRDDLIPERLPSDVYHALHEEAHRFVTAKATIGQFRYRVGYQALVDAEGRPQLVVGVPTLAQQERLQEEQSRTLAYLFGALLILVVVVVLTGVVLANALAQPIAQLREGLEAVGEGRFARALSVDTRDEIGDLVQTFNEMRDQLAESRRKLARQERELAWREMARQVAHEIKNPLTPMKLSVQHLRRAFERAGLEKEVEAPESQNEGVAEEEGDGAPSGDGAPGESAPPGEDGTGRFAELFERITSTLIEQIDGLSRIADEFSSFGRMPTRVTEPLDLSETVEAATSLMQEEEPGAEIRLQLAPEPLVVEADAEELRRLYINLIKNALQALPEGPAGQREGRVAVATERAENGRARSTVTDNGSGIPEDLREKIFQPSFSTKTSGMGLGLAIAKKSVEELGGDIGFDTERGAGTTFWIELPLAEQERAAERERE